MIYANKASTASIPFLGLLLALVRPDGAIFGVIGSAIFLFSVHSKERLNYIVSLIISGFIGVVYFIQRWNYFDEFLPLPLIVKSTSDSILPGSGMNLMFIDFVYFLLCAALFGIFMLRGLKSETSRFIADTVYFIAILFAEQSQNAGMRFQAPLLVATLLFSTIFFSSLHSILCDNLKSFRRTSTLFFSALILLLMPIGMNNAKSTGALIKFVTNPYYINFLPYNLASKVDEDATIALTEAGKLAYWMPGKKYDLIGLNTARTAISGASVQYIEELSPDLIMAHHAGLLGNLTCPNGMDFCVLTGDLKMPRLHFEPGTRVRQASQPIEF